MLYYLSLVSAGTKLVRYAAAVGFGQQVAKVVKRMKVNLIWESHMKFSPLVLVKCRRLAMLVKCSQSCQWQSDPIAGQNDQSLK